MRAMSNARKADDAPDRTVALEGAHACGRRPRVLLSKYYHHGGRKALVRQQRLGQRACRIGERVEDDVGGTLAE